MNAWTQPTVNAPFFFRSVGKKTPNFAEACFK